MRIPSFHEGFSLLVGFGPSLTEEKEELIEV
jgi:hypothetical protein